MSLFRDPQLQFCQRSVGGSLYHIAIQLEARAVTRAIKTIITRLNQAAEVRAYQADRLESFHSGADNRLRFVENDHRIARQLFDGPQIEDDRARRGGLVGEESPQPGQSEYATQSEKGFP